jgi:hypothetical protein
MDESLPWESPNPAMVQYVEEIQSIVLKLSDVRTCLWVEVCVVLKLLMRCGSQDDNT